MQALTWPARAAAALKRGALGRADNPLVRAVGRLPVKVRTKLLVAFLTIATCSWSSHSSVSACSGSPTRARDRLGALQARVAGYGQLEAHAKAMRRLLALCSGGDQNLLLNGGRPDPGARHAAGAGSTSRSARNRAPRGSNAARIRPDAGEAATFDRITRDHQRLKAAVAEIGASQYQSLPAQSRAERSSSDLEVAARKPRQADAERDADAHWRERELVLGIAEPLPRSRRRSGRARAAPGLRARRGR